MDNVFGFSKDGFLSDSEIEALYAQKAIGIKDKDTQNKLFQAQMYDPRKTDIFFGSEEDAHKAEQVAHKLHSMTRESFLVNDYTYKWLDELAGAQIYKVSNNKVLESI